MPLTNVWMRDPNRHGEWVRTTIEQADKNFRTTIQASSHLLRCNICHQYVIFVKGINVNSYFKHNRAEQDKECEDRSFGTSGYTGPGSIDDLPGLLRLQIDDSRAHLEVGLYPVSEEQLQKAILERVKVRIVGPAGPASEFYVDRSRFTPNSTTWLHLHFSWAEKYNIQFSSPSVIPARWRNERLTVSRNGSIFDGETMRMVPADSDIAVGKKYYLLCGRNVIIGFRGGIQSKRLNTGHENWSLYEIFVPEYTSTASDFFFDRFHLRLTAYPSEIIPLWPPVVEKDDVLETKQKELYLYFNGDSEFACYPQYADFREQDSWISDEARLIHLGNIAALQMISSYRNSQKLNALYVCPWDHLPVVENPHFLVTDEDGNPVNEEFLEHAPPRGILKITSDVDGSAAVEDSKGFLYRKEIPAQQDVRLLDLKEGMKVVFRQGMRIAGRIQIGRLKAAENRSTDELLVPWVADPVPFPQRYAWLLAEMIPGSELHTRTLKALRIGFIPKDGLRYILDWQRRK